MIIIYIINIDTIHCFVQKPSAAIVNQIFKGNLSQIYATADMYSQVRHVTSILPLSVLINESKESITCHEVVPGICCLTNIFIDKLSISPSSVKLWGLAPYTLYTSWPPMPLSAFFPHQMPLTQHYTPLIVWLSHGKFVGKINLGVATLPMTWKRVSYTPHTF